MAKTRQEIALEAELAEAREELRLIDLKIRELEARRQRLVDSLDPEDIIRQPELERQIEALKMATHGARARRREATARLAAYRSWAASPLGRSVHAAHRQAESSLARPEGESRQARPQGE